MGFRVEEPDRAAGAGFDQIWREAARTGRRDARRPFRPASTVSETQPNSIGPIVQASHNPNARCGPNGSGARAFSQQFPGAGRRRRRQAPTAPHKSGSSAGRRSRATGRRPPKSRASPSPTPGAPRSRLIGEGDEAQAPRSPWRPPRAARRSPPAQLRPWSPRRREGESSSGPSGDYEIARVEERDHAERGEESRRWQHDKPRGSALCARRLPSRTSESHAVAVSDRPSPRPRKMSQASDRAPHDARAAGKETATKASDRASPRVAHHARKVVSRCFRRLCASVGQRFAASTHRRTAGLSLAQVGGFSMTVANENSQAKAPNQR